MQKHSIISRTQSDLLVARKGRDQLKAGVLQIMLARITNSEAVPVHDRQVGYMVHEGVGSTEVPRRALSEQDIQSIVQQEINELQSAITSMSGHDGSQYVIDLRKKADILKSYLALSS